MVTVRPAFLVEPFPVGFSVRIRGRNGAELMANEGLVLGVEEGVDLPQRVGVVHHEHQFRLHAGSASSTSDHVAGQNFTKVANVKFAARRDAGGHDVRLAALGEALGHDVAPVHGQTSNSDGTNQTTQRDIIDFVARRFVDQNDGERDFATGGSYGLDGLRHGLAGRQHVVNDDRTLAGNLAVLVGEGTAAFAFIGGAKDRDIGLEDTSDFVGKGDAVDGNTNHGVDVLEAKFFISYIGHDGAHGSDTLGANAKGTPSNANIARALTVTRAGQQPSDGVLRKGEFVSDLLGVQPLLHEVGSQRFQFFNAQDHGPQRCPAVERS